MKDYKIFINHRAEIIRFKISFYSLRLKFLRIFKIQTNKKASVKCRNSKIFCLNSNLKKLKSSNLYTIVHCNIQRHISNPVSMCLHPGDYFCTCKESTKEVHH